MEKVTINAEFLFELKNKQDWISKVPEILPENLGHEPHLLWVDSNGDVFFIGEDFRMAENKQSYPCKVYRPQRVAHAK